jgi:biopolymer transport protein ExbB
MLDAIQSAISLITKGGFIMFPILICSVIALTIIIERLYYFRKTQEDPETIFKTLKQLLQDEEDPKALALCKSSPGPVGRLMEAGVHHKDTPTWKLEEKLSVAAQEEVNKMSKNIRVLEVIATISPLMGLLGTVIGMVRAFNKVAEYSGQVDPGILAGGIWEALLTTAAGLSVAIPATVMLHYFDRKIEQVSFLLSKFGQLLIHHFDEGYQHQDSAGSNRTHEKPRFTRVSG